VLYGTRHLPKRHADADMVNGQLESHDILDRGRVARLLLILFEQFHRVHLLLDHLGGLLGFRAAHVVIAVAAKVVHDLAVPEKHVADDRFDDAGLDGEGQRVGSEVHVAMNRVDVLDFADKKVLLFLR
jgi:hypothetical protein